MRFCTMLVATAATRAPITPHSKEICGKQRARITSQPTAPTMAISSGSPSRRIAAGLRPAVADGRMFVPPFGTALLKRKNQPRANMAKMPGQVREIKVPMGISASATVRMTPG